MKNNKKIKETLSEGIYLIPEGCKANVSGGAIQISVKKDNRIKYGDWRCKDWEQRRYEIAKDMMQADLCNTSGFIVKNKEICAREAVEWADALIDELKKTRTRE